MIELIVALFVVTFGVFAVLNMYHFGMDKSRALRENTLVMNELQNEIDTLRAMPFNELPVNWDAGFLATAPQQDRLAGLEPSLVIRPFAQEKKDLLEISASIKWRGDNGRVIKKTLTTLIANKNPGKG